MYFLTSSHIEPFKFDSCLDLLRKPTQLGRLKGNRKIDIIGILFRSETKHAQCTRTVHF